MSTTASSPYEAHTWSAPSAIPKLHSRAREAETARCAEFTFTKSLERIEIPQCIYDSRIGLGLLSKDPIGFAGGDTNLYRMTGNHPNMATDPSGLAEPDRIGFERETPKNAGRAGYAQGTVHNLQSLRTAFVREELSKTPWALEGELGNSRAGSLLRRDFYDEARIKFRKMIEANPRKYGLDDVEVRIFSEELFNQSHGGRTDVVLELATGRSRDEVALSGMKFILDTVGVQQRISDDELMNLEGRWIFDAGIDIAFDPVTYASAFVPPELFVEKGFHHLFHRLPKADPWPRSAVIADGKIDYLFGRAVGEKNSAHNLPRTKQNLEQMRRLGLDDENATSLLQSHFNDVVNDPSNVKRRFMNEWGTYETRESLFSAPNGKHAKFISTWEVLPGGTRRMTTVIPMGQ